MPTFRLKRLISYEGWLIRFEDVHLDSPTGQPEWLRALEEDGILYQSREEDCVVLACDEVLFRVKTGCWLLWSEEENFGLSVSPQDLAEYYELVRS